MGFGGFGGLGYMPKGYAPLPQFYPTAYFPGFDPACLAKYEPAWGHDNDRLKQSHVVLKSGELPPATPDTSMMFKDGFLGRPRHNQLLYPSEKMFNFSLNSPMFIPILDGASPRPPTTR